MKPRILIYYLQIVVKDAALQNGLLMNACKRIRNYGKWAITTIKMPKFVSACHKSLLNFEELQILKL